MNDDRGSLDDSKLMKTFQTPTIMEFEAPNKKKARPLNKNESSSKWAKRSSNNRIIRYAIKPVRIFQFLVVLLIFLLVIYTTNLPDHTLPSVICILLMALCGVYVFVLSLDIIAQFIGGELNMMPMFLFSLLGMIFFPIVAFYLLYVNRPLICPIITMGSLSIIASILFVIDVTLILVFWKHSCELCRPCICARPAEVLFEKEFPESVCVKTVKHDLMTSVSSVEIPTDDAVPDHSQRKIRVAHRREYVDCPISARRLCDVDVADVQTDYKQTLSRKCQTRLEVKEMPAQTVSRCELCKRAIELSASPLIAAPPSTTQQLGPCIPYPAFVQLLRGSTCCSGCKCVTGIIQMSQQQQTQRLEQLKQDKETAKEPESGANKHEVQDPKATAVSGTITKLTLASYCVRSKKTDTSCQTAKKEKKDQSEQTRRTTINAARIDKKPKKTRTASNDSRKMKSPDKVKRKPLKETNSDTKMSLLKTSKCPLYKSSDSVEELIAEKKSVPLPRETGKTIDRLGEIEATKSDDSRVSEGKEDKMTAGNTDDKQQKTETTAGKGSERIAADLITEINTTMHEESETALKENAEDSDVFDDESEKFGKSTVEHSFSEIDEEAIGHVETQTTSAGISFPANRFKRTYGFRRRNKVEPTGLSSTNADTQVPDYNEDPILICSKEVIVEDESGLEAKQVCPACKRIQVPASSSSDQYYTVHRDKKGRFYCEYCAIPSLTTKALHKNDQKRLKCARCGNHLRLKNNRSTRNKSDNCPHCGQTFTPAQ